MKITIAQAAEFLECGERRIEELLREGRLPGLKMGQHWVIPSDSFYSAVEALSVSEAAHLAKHCRPTMPMVVPVTSIGRPRRIRSV